MARSDEERERLKQYQRELYEDRKMRQVCVYCETPLGPDEGTVCAPCEDARAPRQDLYRLSTHGRKVRRKNQSDFVKRRYEAGLCVVCTLPRVDWPAPTPAQAVKRERLAAQGKHPQKCPTCAEQYSKYHRRRDELARQGVLDLERERRQRARDARIAAAKEELERRRRYVPLDEALEATRVRILRALVRFDWIAAGDLYVALELDEDAESAERDRYAQVLSRLSRVGEHIERRKVRALFGAEQTEYRITERGRAELEKVIRTCG